MRVLNFLVIMMTIIFYSTSFSTTILVSNTNLDVNGNTLTPDLLIGDPGPDGISLQEAIWAANSTVEADTILFSPGISGGTIHVIDFLTAINGGPLVIDGDIDSDGFPDITLDGTGGSSHTGIHIVESDVTVKGLTIRSFLRDGVRIAPDPATGDSLIERVVIVGNTIRDNGWNGVAFFTWGNGGTLNDIEVRKNTILFNNTAGVSISAADGVDQHDDQTTNIRIIENTITNSGPTFAISAMAGRGQGGHDNLISDLDIIGNTMSGHTGPSILISAGNEQGCADNAVRRVKIHRNHISGSSVTMEILGGVGTMSARNTVTDLTVTDNTLIGAGIQLVGSTGSLASSNGVDSVVIGWNKIDNCSANGIYLVAGGDGADGNFISNVDIYNNLITNSVDCGILLHASDASSPNNTISDIFIAHNTIVANGNASWAGGINLNTRIGSSTVTGVTIDGNILWNNEGSDYIRGSLTPDNVQYSILNDPRFVGINGNFYSDPIFVSPGTMDYRLQTSSPAVDTGNPAVSGIGDTDLDGRSRIVDGDINGSKIIDIGSCEYEGEMPVLALMEPVDGAIEIACPVDLIWQDINGIFQYQVQVAEDDQFITIVADTTISISTIRLDDQLSVQTVYYWWVKARAGSEWTGWSPFWSFTTACPVPFAPGLISPGNGSIDVDTNAVLEWNPVDGAEWYHIIISESYEPYTVIYDDSLLSTSLSLAGAKAGTEYSWKARVRTVCGWSGWSAARSFRTLCLPISIPVLISPDNHEIDMEQPINFIWHKVLNAQYYNIFMWEDHPPFPVVVDNITEDTTYEISGLMGGDFYWWKVRANNGCEYTNYCEQYRLSPVCPGEIDVVHLLPASGEQVDLPYLFDWQDVPGAGKYRFTVYEYPYAGIINILDSVSVSEYTVNNLEVGKSYAWHVEAFIDCWGRWTQSLIFTVRSIVDVDDAVDASIPKEFTLYQNVPNPFNPITEISYDLPRAAVVRIVIYNILGKSIRTLEDRSRPAGRYSVIWDGRDDNGREVATGMYLYQLDTDSFITARKMLLLK